MLSIGIEKENLFQKSKAFSFEMALENCNSLNLKHQARGEAFVLGYALNPLIC